MMMYSYCIAGEGHHLEGVDPRVRVGKCVIDIASTYPKYDGINDHNCVQFCFSYRIFIHCFLSDFCFTNKANVIYA